MVAVWFHYWSHIIFCLLKQGETGTCLSAYHKVARIRQRMLRIKSRYTRTNIFRFGTKAVVCIEGIAACLICRRATGTHVHSVIELCLWVYARKFNGCALISKNQMNQKLVIFVPSNEEAISFHESQKMKCRHGSIRIWWHRFYSRASSIRSCFARFPGANICDGEWRKSDLIQLRFILLNKHNLSVPSSGTSPKCDRMICFLAASSHANKKRCEAHAIKSRRCL